jgi:hypothetical protein
MLSDIEIAAHEVTTLRRLYRPNEEVSSMNHSTAPDPHPLTRDDDTIEAHYTALERLEAPHGTPHACLNGLVYIGHPAVDPETGEEAEVVESVPCRRCASERSAEASRGGM